MKTRGSTLTRRDTLKLALAAGASSAAAARMLADEPQGNAGRSESRQPKNIIFMVADGMSAGVPSLAEPFSKLVRGRGTNWYRIASERDTALGFFETWSLNSLVTDSAAASSAWSSGSRVFNGALNVLPDGTKLTPIVALARDARRRVGLVSTTTITHATPAGFASVQANRDDEELIAPQYNGAVDVLMGGGRKFFDGDLRPDKKNIAADYAGAGYTIWRQRDDVMTSTRPQRVLGLFSKKHMPFTIDRENSADLRASTPTLAEMTQAALDILGASETGFLLQVEGGRVDHAAHANDAAAILWEQIAFDDALSVALAFTEGRDDTLVVITTDHGNSNPGLNGTGAEYGKSNACFELIAKATASFDHMNDQLTELRGRSEKPTAEAVIELVRAGTAVAISSAEAEVVLAAAAGRLPRELNHQHANLVGVLGQILGNKNGIGWTGTSHTADLALVLARGCGREHFAGLWKNTDACGKLSQLMGIRHVNPTLAPDAARRYMSRVPLSRATHWT